MFVVGNDLQSQPGANVGVEACCEKDRESHQLKKSKNKWGEIVTAKVRLICRRRGRSIKQFTATHEPNEVTPKAGILFGSLVDVTEASDQCQNNANTNTKRSSIENVARGRDRQLDRFKLQDGCLHRALRRLTFDMRGGRKQAKLACGRPLDGRVRLHSRQHGEKWPLATN